MRKALTMHQTDICCFSCQVSEQRSRARQSVGCSSAPKLGRLLLLWTLYLQRSAEATKRLQRRCEERSAEETKQFEGASGSARRWRVLSAPTTQGFGHASEGQTMIFRKKVGGRTDGQGKSSIYDGSG